MDIWPSLEAALSIDQRIYQQFDSAAFWCVLWMLPFIATTLLALLKGQTRTVENRMIAGELPGLPLVLMHSYLFVMSLISFDLVSALIFSWWGPGFLIFAGLVLSKRKMNWKSVATFTSVACKINYVIIVGILFYTEAYIAIYAYSVWIIHDQIKLNWIHLNADRSRRTLEDCWLIRLCYPGNLLLPLFIHSFPYRFESMCISAMLLSLWIIGLIRIIRKQRFYQLPHSYTENLRDIVYLNQAEKHEMA